MKRRRAPTEQRAAVVALCMLGWAGCVSPVDAPPAFEGERYLCGAEDAAAFDAELERCRRARLDDPASCQGFLSLQGVVDSHAIVVDAPVYEAGAVDSLVGVGKIERTFTIRALAPYFIVTLDTSLFRDAADDELRFDPGQDSPDILNLESRGANYFTILVSPTREVELQSETELRARFSAALSRGGAVEGCFHVFQPALR